MQRKTLHKQYKKLGISAVRRIGFSFFAVILIGSILLSLPMSHSVHSTSSYLDHLFVATSATCVTGLVTHVTASEYTLFGQIVIILLIQIGGLGFLTLMSMFFVLLKRKLTYANKIVMQEALNRNSLNETGIYIKRVIKYTVCFELIGAICLAFVFIPQFGILKGIYYSLFHAISAFCNAGFDVFGGGVSLTTHNTNALVILTAAALIIIGGLGFGVWTELYNVKRIRRFSVHTKIVLLVTGFLVIGGTILMLLFEYNNPETIAAMNGGEKVLNSFFAAVTPRTAGFNSISTSGMTSAGKFLTMILMMIGGSPGSTAGGIKTTTVGVLILTVICVIKRREDTEVFSKKISKDLVYKAFTLFFIGSGLVIVVSLILSFTETGASFTAILYETVSAFGTAGLTIGLTPNLSVIGKVLIMLMMYIGRVGPLTVVLSLTKEKIKSGIKYPEGKILIG